MNLFDYIKEGEEFAIISVDMRLLKYIKQGDPSGVSYTIHQVKVNSKKLKEDAQCKAIRKKIKDLKSDQLKREQKIIHG